MAYKNYISFSELENGDNIYNTKKTDEVYIVLGFPRLIRSSSYVLVYCFEADSVFRFTWEDYQFEGYNARKKDEV